MENKFLLPSCPANYRLVYGFAMFFLPNAKLPAVTSGFVLQLIVDKLTLSHRICPPNFFSLKLSLALFQNSNSEFLIHAISNKINFQKQVKPFRNISSQFVWWLSGTISAILRMNLLDNETTEIPAATHLVLSYTVVNNCR